MERLNYNHLRCFWAVAREGSIVAACRTLGLTQPTISKQIGDLEDALGEQLFRRVGRRLVLTDIGRTVYAYADDIFSLGRELTDAVRGQVTGRPLRMTVGVSDVVPKLLTRLTLEPAMKLDQRIRLTCREGKTEQLLADLALAGLDTVLTDAPMSAGSRIKAYSHRLGASTVAVFAPPSIATRYQRTFPDSLNNAPMLLPTDNTALRRSIDAWFERTDVRPEIVARFEDSALLKAFAEGEHGLFLAPSVVEDSVQRQFGVRTVAHIDEITEHLFAVTMERKIRHPGVKAVVNSARASLES
jgi:LysR family transcriptional activator of nhaA